MEICIYCHSQQMTCTLLSSSRLNYTCCRWNYNWKWELRLLCWTNEWICPKICYEDGIHSILTACRAGNGSLRLTILGLGSELCIWSECVSGSNESIFVWFLQPTRAFCNRRLSWQLVSCLQSVGSWKVSFVFGAKISEVKPFEKIPKWRSWD